MLSRFYPGEYLDSTYMIDFDHLYEEGYRGIIFDIDNTLVPHGAPADDRAVTLFERLKGIGFSCCLLSNNQLPRVKSFNDRVNVFFIENAHKPSTKNYRRAMEMMHTDEKTTIFIGDQLFTDVLAASCHHVPCILTEPVVMETGLFFRLKRALERAVDRKRRK